MNSDQDGGAVAGTLFPIPAPGRPLLQPLGLQKGIKKQVFRLAQIRSMVDSVTKVLNPFESLPPGPAVDILPMGVKRREVLAR